MKTKQFEKGDLVLIESARLPHDHKANFILAIVIEKSWIKSVAVDTGSMKFVWYFIDSIHLIEKGAFK